MSGKEIVRSSSSNQNGSVDDALKNIDKNRRELAKISDQLYALIEPDHGFGSKIKSAFRRSIPVVGHMVPRFGILAPVKSRLEQSPADALGGKMRGMIYDVYENVSVLADAHGLRDEAQTELKELLEEVNLTEDEDEKHILTQSLRSKLRENARNDVDLPFDSRTNELMDKLLAGDPDRQRDLDARTIEEAEQRIRLGDLTKEALEAALVGSVFTLDNLSNSYSMVQDFSTDMNALNHNSELVSEATRLNIATLRVLAGSVEAGVLAASIAVDAYNIGTRLDQAQSFKKLPELQKKTESLLKRLPNRLPERATPEEAS